MFKTMIVKALLLPAVGTGAYLAGSHGELPAPPTDAPPVAAAPAPAQAPVGGLQIVATCEEPGDAPRAAQGPAQARKASTRTVTVQVPQGAPAPAAAQAPSSTSEAPQVAAAAPPATGTLDANTATAADFDALPAQGITAPVAQAIVDHRTELGGRYTSLAQIYEVKGVGPATERRLPELVHV